MRSYIEESRLKSAKNREVKVHNDNIVETREVLDSYKYQRPQE
jgi:hypothetical protein